MKKAKLIYIMGGVHSVQKSLIQHPPKGYGFLKSERFEMSPWEKKIHGLKGKLSYNPLIKNIWELAKVFYNPIVRKYKKTADMDKNTGVKKADFLFTGRILPTSKPYWLEVEHVRQLMGWDIRLLKKWSGWISEKLSQDNCKLITSYTKKGINTLIDNLPNSEKFKDKCHFVHNAVPSVRYKKNYDKKELTIAFLGSKALPYDFYMKGGIIALEAFKILSKKYEHLKFLVKPWAPEQVKKKYSGIKNLKFEGITTDYEMDLLLKEIDILVSPIHNTPAKLFLDCMNYSIPVITTDVWANSEIVKDKYNGLLIPASKHFPYYVLNNVPNSRTKGFNKAIKNIDHKMVGNIVKKVELLIKNKGLRKKLGENGKREIESGEFSIKKRNKKYKKLFDKYF